MFLKAYFVAKVPVRREWNKMMVSSRSQMNTRSTWVLLNLGLRQIKLDFQKEIQWKTWVSRSGEPLFLLFILPREAAEPFRPGGFRMSESRAPGGSVRAAGGGMEESWVVWGCREKYVQKNLESLREKKKSPGKWLGHCSWPVTLSRSCKHWKYS